METLVFAVKHKDKDIVNSSSSGGMFTALTDYYLREGNSVASCVYNYETDSVDLVIYDEESIRNSARGSKYIQATIGEGFINIVNWLKLNQHKSLIVFGTGCQMEGLRKLLELKKLRERVVLVDLICHGATSPGLWRKYLELKDYRGKMQYLSFKDKRNGWHEPTVYALVEGRERSIKDFSEWFYGGWAIRKSCYKCPFAKIERNTDITIGDYWGIENVLPNFADSKGVSLALIHSEAGKNLFEKIKADVEYVVSNKSDCLQPRLISPANEPSDRGQFWLDINENGLEACLTNYKEPVIRNPLWKRLARKMKHFIKSLLAKLG